MRGLTLGLCVALLAGLAGCTTPKDAVPEDPLFGLCPQWDQGPGGQATGFHLVVDANNTEGVSRAERELAPSSTTWANHAFDVFRIRIDAANVTGRLELRAYSAAPENKQLALRDYRGDAGAQLVPVVSIGPGDVGKEFDVFLSSIAQDSQSASLPARLQWTLEGSNGDATVEYAVTFLYKVCGADL